MNLVRAIDKDKVIVRMPDGTERRANLVRSNNPEYVAQRAEACVSLVP